MRKKLLFTFITFLLLAVYQRVIGLPLQQEEISKQQIVHKEKSRSTSEPTPIESEPTAVEGVQTTRQVGQVTKVVDGDTIEVSLNENKEKIRVIGINTPETVDPRRGVQCFGKEASAFAKELLNNQTVHLESDPTQTERDKYGRLLRYVWLDNGTVDFGKLMILEGYAHEYTYDVPYIYQAEYQEAQKEAQETKEGLWQDNACSS